MRYKAKTKECRLTVKVWADFRKAFDTQSIAAFERINLQGFLKPRLIRKNLIEYSGLPGMSISNWLQRPVTKRDFLCVVEQFLIAIRKLKSNTLPLEFLVIDLHYVFIHEHTKEIQFLYVPGHTSIHQKDVMSFLDNITYSVHPAPESDTDYISRFVFFIKSQKNIDLDQLELFIAKEDESLVRTLHRIHRIENVFITSPQTNCFNCDNVDNRAKNELITVRDPIPLDEEYESDFLDEEWTVLLDKPKDRTLIHTASLYRVRTHETICVNKPIFRIGKESSHVDYYVPDNNAISRTHADIVTCGGRYYVVDLVSRNRTYINNHQLAAHCETEIRNGDRLRLANEEFIFMTVSNKPLNSAWEEE